MGLELLQSSGEFPCAVCCTGVGCNSIFCSGCKHWVHKKCSGLKRLTKDPDYRCTRCQGTACPLDGRPQKEVKVRPDKLKVVASFCYLGDMLSAAGGCKLSTTRHLKTAWKKFLIVLGFNDTSTLEGHFVSSPREREKRDRRESRGDEREGQGRKRNRNESEETEEIKTFPLHPYPLQG